MATLHNEIVISAPIERIWKALSEIENLDKYDPTVLKSTAISQSRSGVGAKRKVVMRDGKNWFEEQCTAWKPNEALSYELTACSFPIHKLNHSYSFETRNSQVKVKQVMQYKVKFGWFGKLLDDLMIRKQSDSGIKRFLSGLKSFAENSTNDIPNGLD
jgi:ribosome-associated toxin RatA of RatAB toxin-antitoxin module